MRGLSQLVVIALMSGSVGSANSGGFGISVGSFGQEDMMSGNIILVDGGYTEQKEEKERRERKRAREDKDKVDYNLKDDRSLYEIFRATLTENRNYWRERYRENQKKMDRQKYEGGSNRGQNRNNDAEHNYGAPGDGIY